MKALEENKETEDRLETETLPPVARIRYVVNLKLIAACSYDSSVVDHKNHLVLKVL